MSYNVYFEYGFVHFLKSFKDVAEGIVEQVVLIKEPTKLTHVEIRDLLDTDKKNRSYTVTLYTETWQISIDDTIDITNDRSRDDREIRTSESDNGSVYLNLHNIESFRVAIKKKEQDDVLNVIQHIASPIDYDTSSEETGPVPFKNSDLDNCSVMLTQCELTKSDKLKETEQCMGALQQCTLYKSNLEQKHTDCEKRISKIQQEHNIDKEQATKICIGTIDHWKDQKESCDTSEHDLKRENEELKKQIGKKSNGSQSTPNSSIITCVAIIILLLGLCIYLYFFKR